MSVVEKHISSFNWKNNKLLLACSGGVDSVVLFHALLSQKIQFAVVHVNYQLRGNDSEEDETFVRNMCSTYGIPLRVFKCPTELTKADNSSGSSKGKNLQNEARKFRYSLFEQWTAISKKHKVLLAHHQNDQIETFFLQHFRGSGTFGLRGMRLESNQIIRPFLELSKDQLKHYANEKKLEWREDASNSSSNYLRNLFRNEIIPKLQADIPTLTESIVIFQSKLDEAIEFETKHSEKWINEVISHLFIPTEEWQNTAELTKLLLLKELDLPAWFLKRLNEGFRLNLSAELRCEDTWFYKGTKGMYIRNKNAIQKQWEYKIEKSIPEDSCNNNEKLICSAKIDVSQLRLRGLTTNDKIQLAGMNGQKRGWDLLKEAGIPSQIRSEQQVLTLENQVLWIPNIAVSASPFTKKDDSSTITISLIEKMK